MAGQLYAGASGFSYPGWRGHFYPGALSGSRMLEFYAERLNGVELNGSFYRTPPATTLSGWAARTPPGFRFCLKAHRGLTYSGEAFDRVGLAAMIAPQLAVLGARLGPLLLQFPPVRKVDLGLLDALLEAMAVPAAAEFRDASWFAASTYAVLERRGAALVVTDEEKWPLAPVSAWPASHTTGCAATTPMTRSMVGSDAWSPSWSGTRRCTSSSSTNRRRRVARCGCSVDKS